MEKLKVIKILIWGMGEIYNRYKNAIAYFEYSKQFEVIGITATTLPRYEYIDGYKVISPQEAIREKKFDYIIIMSDRFFHDIAESLKNEGILDNEIVSYKFLEIPNVKFIEYLALKHSRITIISNNCWGGILYHTLGLECLSPTKNLFIKDGEYLKFVENFDYYISCEPVYSRDDIDPTSLKKYPVLKLDDIEIHCNHDESSKDAIRNWKRRVNKVNLNNIFVEMYTEDQEIAKRFLDIKGYNKGICFVPWELDNEFAIKLEKKKNQAFWEAVNLTANLNNYYFNYEIIKMLGGEIRYR